MNQKRGYFAITYDNDRKFIYAFGGKDGHKDLKLCEKYNVEDDEWTVITPMEIGKSEASACIVNSEFIFVIGGHIHDYGCFNDIDKYSITDNSWSTILISSDQEQEFHARMNAFAFQINPS